MQKIDTPDDFETDNSKYLKWIVYGIIFMAIVIFKVVIKKEFSKNDFDSNFKSDNTTNPNTMNETVNIADDTNQNWFTNTQHGLFFETPKSVKGGRMETPQGTEDYYNTVYSYTLNHENLAINYTVMDTNFDTFDTKLGLKEAINNLLNTANVNDLHLEFTIQEGKYNSHTCIGNADYKGIKIAIKGYCLFYKEHVFMIIGSGEDNEILKDKLNRIFSSIKVPFEDDTFTENKEILEKATEVNNSKSKNLVNDREETGGDILGRATRKRIDFTSDRNRVVDSD
jgi:hypothetical protein